MIYNKEITINETGTAPRYNILDSHLHFLDFTQDSDGFPALVKAMDLCGVSEAVVFGMPMVKKWDYLMRDKPLYEDELIRALEHNRNCKIIWAHVGVSRRIVMDDLLILAGHLLHDKLKPETAEKLCRKNALSLIKKRGVFE